MLMLLSLVLLLAGADDVDMMRQKTALFFSLLALQMRCPVDPGSGCSKSGLHFGSSLCLPMQGKADATGGLHDFVRFSFGSVWRQRDKYFIICCHFLSNPFFRLVVLFHTLSHSQLTAAFHFGHSLYKFLIVHIILLLLVPSSKHLYNPDLYSETIPPPFIITYQIS